MSACQQTFAPGTREYVLRGPVCGKPVTEGATRCRACSNAQKARMSREGRSHLSAMPGSGLRGDVA